MMGVTTKGVIQMATEKADLKTDSYGACSYAKVSPSQLSADTPALNFVVSFEEALKLNLAIDECVRKLGRYNRAKIEGKRAGLMMVVHLDKRRIRILEGKV
jgi:hypothetical protein